MVTLYLDLGLARHTHLNFFFSYIVGAYSVPVEGVINIHFIAGRTGRPNLALFIHFIIIDDSLPPQPAC